MTRKPNRRRLTQAELEDVLAKALSDRMRIPTEVAGEAKPLVIRTGRRKSWWQRGWKR